MSAQKPRYHRVSSTSEKLRLMGFNLFIFCKILLNPPCLHFWFTCEVDKKTTMLFYYFLNHLKPYWGLRDKNIYLVPGLLKFFPNSNIYSCLKNDKTEKEKEFYVGKTKVITLKQKWEFQHHRLYTYKLHLSSKQTILPLEELNLPSFQRDFYAQGSK